MFYKNEDDNDKHVDFCEVPCVSCSGLIFSQSVIYYFLLAA